MELKLKLAGRGARLGAIAVAITACALLLYLAYSNFALGILADERVVADRETLALASARYPGSARLHAKLASAEISARSRN
ncbi:MAG TPA: hypothetical protein VFQ92_22155, partial [Blastocatellia bacterium]|nr:hypothetical protein [Blastocatellia bacterium]